MQTARQREERARKTLRRVRVRVTRSFSLSIVVDARIKELARQRGLSCSRIVEDLIGGIDYAEIFTMFDEQHTFSQIVRATNLPPMLVREVYADYTAGLKPPPMEEPSVVREQERVKAASIRRDAELLKTERSGLVVASRERIKQLEATVRTHEANERILKSKLEANGRILESARAK
jgi:hypothetical protein